MGGKWTALEPYDTRGDFTVNGTDSSVLLPQINTDFIAKLVYYDVANTVWTWWS